MLRHEVQEVDRRAGPAAVVQQLEAGDVSDPRLERADVEHRRVGDGQQQQEQVDRLAAHARTQQHRQ